MKRYKIRTISLYLIILLLGIGAVILGQQIDKTPNTGTSDTSAASVCCGEVSCTANATINAGKSFGSDTNFQGGSCDDRKAAACGEAKYAIKGDPILCNGTNNNTNTPTATSNNICSGALNSTKCSYVGQYVSYGKTGATGANISKQSSHNTCLCTRTQGTLCACIATAGAMCDEDPTNSTCDGNAIGSLCRVGGKGAPNRSPLNGICKGISYTQGKQSCTCVVPTKPEDSIYRERIKKRRSTEALSGDSGLFPLNENGLTCQSNDECISNYCYEKVCTGVGAAGTTVNTNTTTATNTSTATSTVGGSCTPGAGNCPTGTQCTPNSANGNTYSCHVVQSNICGTGSCNRYLSFKCNSTSDFTNGSCYNGRAEHSSFASAQSAIGGCGQVDTVCSNSDTLCGDFVIQKNNCMSTISANPTPTLIPPVTITPTPTVTVTPSPTVTPTPTPTVTVTPSPTVTPTPTPTVTVTPNPTVTPTVVITPTPISCGGGCTTSAQCQIGHQCYQGVCTLNLCVTNVNLCQAGGCSPLLCGNGIVNQGEACDDGNLINGDGCSTSCQIETIPNTALLSNEADRLILGISLVTLGFLIMRFKLSENFIKYYLSTRMNGKFSKVDTLN